MVLRVKSMEQLASGSADDGEHHRRHDFLHYYHAQSKKRRLHIRIRTRPTLNAPAPKIFPLPLTRFLTGFPQL